MNVGSIRWIVSLVSLVAALLITPVSQAQVPGIPTFGRQSPAVPKFNDSRDEVSTKLYLNATQVAPGQDVVAAVVLNINPTWHLWPRKGPLPAGTKKFDTAVWTTLHADVTETGVTIHQGFAQWPTLHEVEADLGDGKGMYAVYEGLAAIFVPITIDASATPGTRKLTFTVDFQCCSSKTCLLPASVVAAPSA